jgi:hypothetical protein
MQHVRRHPRVGGDPRQVIVAPGDISRTLAWVSAIVPEERRQRIERLTARDDRMRRKPVSSSMIASVGYAVRTRTLEIEFLSGRIYQYFAIDRDTYDALLRAPSLGTYFNEYIKDDYSYVRLA